MNKKLIAIIGPAGVGKTSVIKELEKLIKINYPQLKINCLFEKEKYPFLDNQYNNKKKWAFITQIDFLTLRARELYAEYTLEDKTNLIITDRLYLDDYLYLYSFYQDNSINEKEYQCYNLLFEKYQQMFKNEKIIFDYVFILRADFNIILERLKKRDRSFAEIEKEDKYWKKHYDLYFNENDHLNLIKKNVKQMNIIDNNKSINKTANEIINIINL